MASTKPVQWGTRCLRIGSLSPLSQHPASFAQIQPSASHIQQQTRTIRSILKPPPKKNRFDTSLGLAPLALSTGAPLERKAYTLPWRTGLLATKKAMSSMYDSDGKRIPVTLLQLDRCQIVGHKTRAKHGYFAVQIGHGWRDHRNLTRPELGHLAKVGVPPKEQISEFRVRDETGLVPVGTMMSPSWFKLGQLVDVRGITKGKGFAGGMKRHGWAGQPASHGQSLTHRTMGSAGGSQGSGSRVIPGKNMPGRMGGQQHTVQNLQVMWIDEENGIIAVKGCLSGPMKSIVKIQDAIKRPGQAKTLGLPTVPVSVLAAEAARKAKATA